MSYFSISKFAEMTGMARETVAKRLSDLEPRAEGNSKRYESKDALPLLYQVEGGGDKATILMSERGRLAKAQADKTELEVAQLRGELIPREIVVATWQAFSANARAKLLSLPTKAAHAAITATELHEIEEVLKKQVYEALEELVSDGIPDGYQGIHTDAGSDAAATESNGESVGRQVSKTQPGGKRRARTVAN